MMYRPPENFNRVKSIKSKFENVEKNNIYFTTNGPRSNLSQLKNDENRIENLSRQNNDSSKRSIKRTPAFRIDFQLDKNNFQRTTAYNRSFCGDKLQRFHNDLAIDCDKNKNVNTARGGHSSVQVVKTGVKIEDETGFKPLLRKSKSSQEFKLIRSKFDHVHDLKEENDSHGEVQTLALYTKPIPKSLRCGRINQCNETTKKKCEIESIHNDVTLQIHNSKQDSNDTNTSVGLSDTLKAALNRPLPLGPAPQKPPRTFEHVSKNNKSDASKNTSFLHSQCTKKNINGNTFSDSNSKHDARYMLTKLENALRNNKIKTAKASKFESSTTSGDDSDDSVLFKSKSQQQNNSVSLPTNSHFNLNCLHGLTICTTYEKIKEPNSLFFINQNNEPVYDEPFNFSEKSTENKLQSIIQEPGNTLHYLSTPLLDDEEHNKRCLTMTEDFKQGFEESSSQSSFMSGSAASTPLEENGCFEPSNKIRELINTFETKVDDNISTKNNLNCSVEGASRIEELKNSLEKTLERCFDHDLLKSEQDQIKNQINFDSIVNKFQTYVKTMPKYERPALSKNDCLFYCCLIVGWDREKPLIKFKFPSKVIVPDKIEDLCFPEATNGPLDISDNAQCYSLVITNDKGERTFGYCRRIIPEGSNKCLPLTYCILSKHRAPRFFKRLLIELESRHGIPDKLRDELINSFYFNKFPRPGESIRILLPKSINDYSIRNMTENFESVEGSNVATELILTLHHDTRYEEADLKPLHTLSADILLKIFATLLLERKVILISCVISKLSSCVDSLQSILYPFSWPHTFIPILPECLWDVVESPTPLICGILSVSVINDHKIEHGIVVDLDEGNILSEEGDEDNILSTCMKKAWQQGMNLAKVVPSEGYVHSVYLGDAYIKVFIVSLKHYKDHISENTFDKDSFIKNGKTKGIRRFLKWFTETTMFSAFIESVLSNPHCYGLFDKKIEMYGSNGSDVVLTKLLEWKK